MKLFKYFLIATTLFICIFFIYIATIKPSNQKQWNEQFAVNTRVEIKGNEYTFKNVRDWKWDKSGALSKEYINKSVDVEELENVWFLLQPFDTNKRLAHTFLIFDFINGETISLSIEARREQGETYNGLLGAFKKYEIMYMWGTEKDFIGKRAVYDNQTIYMYPLKISNEYKKQLFIHLVNKTNSLYSDAEFYNTFTSNCTNSLAKVANEINKNSVPINISWWLTGLSDKYLYKLGYINTNTPIDQIRQRYKITQFANASINEEDFSILLRDYLK